MPPFEQDSLSPTALSLWMCHHGSASPVDITHHAALLLEPCYNVLSNNLKNIYNIYNYKRLLCNQQLKSVSRGEMDPTSSVLVLFSRVKVRKRTKWHLWHMYGIRDCQVACCMETLRTEKQWRGFRGEFFWFSKD